MVDVLPAEDELSETGADVCEVAVVLMGGTPPSADNDGLGECPTRECGGRIGFEGGAADVNM